MRCRRRRRPGRRGRARPPSTTRAPWRTMPILRLAALICGCGKCHANVVLRSG
jgi:hypothetical protein